MRWLFHDLTVGQVVRVFHTEQVRSTFLARVVNVDMSVWATSVASKSTLTGEWAYMVRVVDAKGVEHTARTTHVKPATAEEALRFAVEEATWGQK